MGNLLSQTQKIYTIKWKPPKIENIYVLLEDLTDLPYHLYGKIIILFSQVSQKEEFIQQNHHKVILVNDLDQIKTFMSFKFRGIPIVSYQQLIKQPEKCLEKHFDCRYCPIPLILQRFNQNLLRNYLNAFYVYGLNVQYYERLEIFMKSECTSPLIVCSNFELQQLSHRIQNMNYRNQKSQKLSILCFCNKDQYNFPKKTEIIMQRNNIEVILFQNMLEIIQKINKGKLKSPITIPQKRQKIYFYVDQKEKEVNYLSKMAKKIEKTVKYVKIQKVVSKSDLIQEIRCNQYSVVVIGKDSKQMKNYIQIQQNLEEEGLEDRVVFLRRENQINDKIINKIENITLNPKYITKSITQKYIVFYGSLQNFKYALKYFPKLNFKRFIDSCADDQILKNFLGIKSQVIMTNLRVCHCMEKWKDQIKCKVILVKFEVDKEETPQKAETKGCLKQQWYSYQQQLISAFESYEQQLQGLNYNFNYKKVAYISTIITQIFSKFKQKKNILLNDNLKTIFLFSCEYYFFEQISNIVIKYFNSKELGSFDKDCQFQHLKQKLYRELIHIKKSVGIEKEVISFLEQDQSSNIFQLSDKIIECVVKYPVFFQEINNIWQLLICRDRAEYHTNCKILLFLMILGFNKTNFVQYHNETLQNITLRVKSGFLSYEHEAKSEFLNKNKNSYVYNFSFLICEEVKHNAIKQPGQIFIKIEGSQLNNFGLYLPVWRNQRTFLLAPLTKLQLCPQEQFLMLKLTLNIQQKLLQRFTQHFLVQKSSLKLFGQEFQMRKIDCFLQNMYNNRLQKAAYVLNNILQQSASKNLDLINAYVIFHNLKSSQIDKAQKKLRKDKYYEILSSLIASCKEGSSMQAVHSSFNSDQKELYQTKQQKNLSLSNSQIQSIQRNYKEKNKVISNDCKLYRPYSKRNTSQIFSSQYSNKRRSRYCVFSIKQNIEKTIQMNQIMQRKKSMKVQESLKIKILPPTNEFKINCLQVQKQQLRQEQDNNQKLNRNDGFDKKNKSQLQYTSKGCKKSDNSKNAISKFIKFLDRQSVTQEDNKDESQKETTTSLGIFKYGNKNTINQQIQEKNQRVYQEKDLIQAFMLEQIEKNQDIQNESEKNYKNKVINRSIGKNKQRSLSHKRKTEYIKGNTIENSSYDDDENMKQLDKVQRNKEESLQIILDQKIIDLKTQNRKKNIENLNFERIIEKKLFTFCKNEEALSYNKNKKTLTRKIQIQEQESLVLSYDSNRKQRQKSHEEKKQQSKQLYKIFKRYSSSTIQLLDEQQKGRKNNL